MNDNAAPNPTDSAIPPLPPVCLLGLDDAGKPHASRFAGTEADLATKAAGLMGLHVLPLTGPEGDALAAQLPEGRIFPSGKAFAPFVARPLYERLAALGGLPVPPPAPKSATAPKPPKVVGSAIVVDGPKPGSKAAKRAASNLSPSPAMEPREVPTDWARIGKGGLVLASTGGPGEGWFECVVAEVKPDDLMVLHWRDWPDEALFLRRRDQLALLPVGTPLTA